MQFHLNGFRPGDPDIRDAADGHPQSRDMPDKIDVLIVGCGPAGLTLAAQLSAFPEITTRIVEAKPGPMEKGQADGISCRSMEMFNAFGFADRIMREAHWVNETTFWKPDPDHPGNIARTGRVQDVEDGLSEMPHVILNQARVHDMYLEFMRNSPSRLTPDYAFRLAGLRVTDDPDHPVRVTLARQKPGHEGQVDTLRARYVVGCDGARSAVRAAIGRDLIGDSAHQAWGVMDVLAVTDFPDIRHKCIIQSETEGNMLIIPREGGHLVRLYVEMDQLNENERVSSRNLQVEDLIAAANRILAPYTVTVKDTVWWSVYEIGQRLTDKFDDVPADKVATRLPRVFIAGDACHTHSPKAGQGMNVSMGDTFNLGWKLIAVLTGRAAPDLLHSYSEERKDVAQGLIDFDHEWARIISAPPEEGDPDAAPRFQRHFVAHGRYTAGVSVRYTPSVLTGDGRWQQLATGFEIGTRLHSAPVIRLADAKPMQLGHVIEADARWRVFAFCDGADPGNDSSPIRTLCDFLENAPHSSLHRHRKPGDDIDAVIDLRAVFQQHPHDLDIGTMPDLLIPSKGRLGLQDREKMFCPDLKTGADIFDLRGIDRAKGCLVIVRPDQYVANILPLNAHDALADFFAGVLLDVSDD